MLCAFITFNDPTHAAIAAYYAALLPEGWTSLITQSGTTAVNAGASLIAYPWPIEQGMGLLGAGRLVVSGHQHNAPVRYAGAFYDGHVAVSAAPASAVGAAGITSYGPGLSLAVDPVPFSSGAQSWAAFAAALYLARAWTAYGTRDAAQASLVAATRAASGGAPWTEALGYGVLPGMGLPAPGALLSTTAGPAPYAYDATPGVPVPGASVTAEARDVNGVSVSGWRIVVPQRADGDTFRATQIDHAALVSGRLYRYRRLALNLAAPGAPTRTIGRRASGTRWLLPPGQLVEIDGWEVANPVGGADNRGQWSIASSLTNDDAGTLDLWVSDAVVDTYEGGPLTLTPLAAPVPVAPFVLGAAPGEGGTYTVTWSSVPDPDARCVVSADGEDVATTTERSASVYLSAGEHEVGVRLASGETEGHSAIAVTSTSSVVYLKRGGRSIFASWAPVPGAASYRVEFATSPGGAPFAVVETTGRAAEAVCDEAAEARVVSIDSEGDEVEVGRAYAVGAGAPLRLPAYL